MGTIFNALLGLVGGSKVALIAIGAALLAAVAAVMLYLMWDARGARIETLQAEKQLLANANAAQEKIIALQDKAAADIDRVTGRLDKVLEAQGRDFNDIRIKIAKVGTAQEVACGAAVGLALDELRRRAAHQPPGGAAAAGARPPAPLPRQAGDPAARSPAR
jgi:type II secretory pathway component PulM